MHMVATDEVYAGIYTLLCMFSQLIKREHQDEERMWVMWSRSEGPEHLRNHQ